MKALLYYPWPAGLGGGTAKDLGVPKVNHPVTNLGTRWTFPPPSSGAAGFPAPVFSHSYPYIIFVPSHWKYFSIIFLFCNAFLAEQTQRFPWDISMKTNILMKHKYIHETFPWNTNISMKHKYFHETFPWNKKNLSVKYNIICFEAKIIFLFCNAFLAEHKSSYT